MKYTIQDYDRRLKATLDKLERSSLPGNNRHLILDFKEECFSNGLSRAES